MSRQIGSLHRSNSHPANLQTQIPIFPLFAFPPSDSPVIIIPSSTNSDNNSDISVFHTISQFNNSDIETPSTHTQTNSSAFTKPPFNPSRSVNHYQPFPLLLTLPRLPQPILPLIPTDRIKTPQIISKFPKNLTTLLHCNNN